MGGIATTGVIGSRVIILSAGKSLLRTMISGVTRKCLSHLISMVLMESSIFIQSVGSSVTIQVTKHLRLDPLVN